MVFLFHFYSLYLRTLRHEHFQFMSHSNEFRLQICMFELPIIEPILINDYNYNANLQDTPKKGKGGLGGGGGELNGDHTNKEN